VKLAAGLIVGLTSWLGSPCLAQTGPTVVSMTNGGYPAHAFQRSGQGTASYTVEVNERGRADKCIITQSSGWVDLDRETCKNLRQRTIFSPAKDKDGKAVRGTYSNKMRWAIPQD